MKVKGPFLLESGTYVWHNSCIALSDTLCHSVYRTPAATKALSVAGFSALKAGAHPERSGFFVKRYGTENRYCKRDNRSA